MIKKITLLILLIFSLTFESAQSFTGTRMRKAKRDAPVVPMISVWKTDNPGTSSSNQISLPLESGATYNFTVAWGDGTSSTITSWDDAAKTHTYASAGTYTVTMTGVFDKFRFIAAGDAQKILDITQWGGNAWADMEQAFAGCSNLQITAVDAPNLENIISLLGLFYGATNFNSPINHWDMSNIQFMSAIFAMATSFNQDISNWNTSNVIHMDSMFYQATAFNQNIGSWNVANVEDMTSMFYLASSFNQNISGWNTESVVSMNTMFTSASSFNQNLTGWNVNPHVIMCTGFKSGTSAAWTQYPAFIQCWPVDIF